ncbi:MAG: response regulator transcription factor [Anaerolineae bacterium]|nr:response regulator transcription factor [Anaerolineae bacterium]
MSKPIQVLLADSEESVRSALSLLLSQEPHLRVVGEATTADQLLGQIESIRPDLLLFAWGLPGCPSVALLGQMAQRRPDMRILVLASRPEARAAALQAGAHAFVSKVDPPERLLGAIRDMIGTRDAQG